MSWPEFCVACYEDQAPLELPLRFCQVCEVAQSHPLCVFAALRETSFATCYLLFDDRRAMESLMALPDGPKASSVYQMLQWVVTPFRFMRDCYRRYGDCFTIRLSQRFGPLVFASHPEALQTILTNDDGKLFDAPGEINVLLQPVIGTQSVIGLSGDRHWRARQLLMPPFHGERMRSYGALIQEVAEQVMSRQEPGNRFPARKPMQTTSLRVILRAIFGLQDGPRYRQLEKLMTAMLEGLGNPSSASLLFFPMLRQDLGPQSPWGRFIRTRQQIDELIYAEIAERRRSEPDGARADILSLLLSARDETGAALTNTELRDELMTLLTAGHETTATALTWALYWIHRLPDVRYRLLEELKGLNGELDPAVVSRLPYLNAVCSETLRIHSVALLTFPRIARSRVELMGISIEPGTIVTGCIYLAHRRPEVYPDPEQFKPDRFLDRHYSPFEFLPFGGGVRRCIGMTFAQFEMKLVLSTILTRFQLARADSGPVHHRRRGVTSGPSRFRMVVVERAGTSGSERGRAGASAGTSGGV